MIGSPDETEDKSLTGSQTQVFLAHSQSDEKKGDCRSQTTLCGEKRIEEIFCFSAIWKYVSVMTFLQNYITLLFHISRHFQRVALKGCLVLSKTDQLKPCSVYYAGCHTYHSSLQIKYPMSDAKRLILHHLLYNKLTLNLNDSITKANMR